MYITLGNLHKIPNPQYPLNNSYIHIVLNVCNTVPIDIQYFICFDHKNWHADFILIIQKDHGLLAIQD